MTLPGRSQDALARSPDAPRRSLNAPGRFGRSHALAVARRMGLPSQVVEHARGLLDAESRRMDDLLTEVETERERLRTQAIAQAET